MLPELPAEMIAAVLERVELPAWGALAQACHHLRAAAAANPALLRASVLRRYARSGPAGKYALAVRAFAAPAGVWPALAPLVHPAMLAHIFLAAHGLSLGEISALPAERLPPGCPGSLLALRPRPRRYSDYSLELQLQAGRWSALEVRDDQWPRLRPALMAPAQLRYVLAAHPRLVADMREVWRAVALNEDGETTRYLLGSAPFDPAFLALLGSGPVYRLAASLLDKENAPAL